ncbi:serine hydrolase domain-containing protein [Phytohabitans aurantiacus]|uniref:Hydrolase n=1 Tax=Phytohabitans aurantiacus TaxID=3016789 RepID=A0ABQ5QRN9_9ACTN|nr:serine hydrolase domain-containing protein [Phytohabitans aurantiacus]GLH95985.1 hydrolase [Phytohabitans aurantiacus]
MSNLSRSLRTVATALVLAVSATALPASASADTDNRALRQALSAVHTAGAPGAFAEARDGGRVWAGATGIANLANAAPTRPHMRHRVGSITKTFVAATILQLAGERRLGLDDPVGKLLPDLVTGEVGERVTVRMLLNHTSGIGNYTDALLTSVGAVVSVGTTTYTPAELVAIALGMPRTGEPGAAYSYSNSNYILAGLIIQRLTGNDPATEITRRILRPLRLTDTYFPGADPAIRGPHAGAYFASLGVRDLSTYKMTWGWMAGELISTTSDLNDFYRALFGGKVLSPALLAQMRTTVPFDPSEPEAGGYGLGVYFLASPCGQIWGHDGGVIGQITISWHLPDLGRQVTYAQNFSHYQLTPELHPIDEAFQAFLVRALCPEALDSSTAPRDSATPAAPAAPAAPLRLVDQGQMPVL